MFQASIFFITVATLIQVMSVFPAKGRSRPSAFAFPSGVGPWLVGCFFMYYGFLLFMVFKTESGDGINRSWLYIFPAITVFSGVIHLAGWIVRQEMKVSRK